MCNNMAWDLIEKSDLTANECFDLLRLTGAASYHWSEVGTSRNIAHADLLFSLALSQAGVGAGALAVDVADRTLRYFTENQSEDWERAFAHAAMAASYYCAGNEEGHYQHYNEAQLLEDKLAAGDLKVFQTIFRNIPRPTET